VPTGLRERALPFRLKFSSHSIHQETDLLPPNPEVGVPFGLFKLDRNGIDTHGVQRTYDGELIPPGILVEVTHSRMLHIHSHGPSENSNLSRVALEWLHVLLCQQNAGSFMLPHPSSSQT